MVFDPEDGAIAALGGAAPDDVVAAPASDLAGEEPSEPDDVGGAAGGGGDELAVPRGVFVKAGGDDLAGLGEFGGGGGFAAVRVVPAGQERTPSVFVLVHGAYFVGVGQEPADPVMGEEPAQGL